MSDSKCIRLLREWINDATIMNPNEQRELMHMINANDDAPGKHIVDNIKLMATDNNSSNSAPYQVLYSLMLEYGTWGVKMDLELAFEMAKRSHEVGYVPGTYQFGDCYYFGVGVKEDNVMAFSLYRKAHESGHIIATHDMGYCYGVGRGVKRDKVMARRYIQIAADGGYAVAMCRVGYRFEEKNREEACKWYRKALITGYSTRDSLLRIKEMNAEAVQPHGDWHPLVHFLVPNATHLQIKTLLLMRKRTGSPFAKFQLNFIMAYFIPFIASRPY